MQDIAVRIYTLKHTHFLYLLVDTFTFGVQIVIGLPMTTASFNEDNPFAIKFLGPKEVTSNVLAHQPKSSDWRARGAKAHAWKRVSDEVFSAACEQLNQIITICA